MSNIPVIILNRDRLTYTRILCEQLLSRGYTNLYIYDIGSTYEPLLEWYANCDYIKVEFIKGDHKSFWSQGHIHKFATEFSWIAVTDSDIELNPTTPTDFIEQLIVAAKDFRIDKAALAIEYKNIPNLFLSRIIEASEGSYWQSKLQHDHLTVYSAQTDTHFHVCRTDRPFQYHSIRIAGDFTCKHLPWYENWLDMTSEQIYYMDHCDPFVATIAQHYQRFLLS